MKLKIENSFYKFYPRAKHELDLLALRGFIVYPHRDFFTFENLISLPSFSIKGADFGGLKAIETYSGRVEDVLKANRFVFDLVNQKLKEADKVVSKLTYSVSDIIMMDGLPQCGAFMRNNKKLRSASGYWRLQSSGAVIIEATEYY